MKKLSKLKNPESKKLKLNAVGAFILTFIGYSIIAMMVWTAFLFDNDEVASFVWGAK